MKALPAAPGGKLLHWWRRTGRLNRLFLLCLVIYLALLCLPRSGGLQTLDLLLLIPLGLVLLLRLTRLIIRAMIWRLRYRLLVTYLFIAVIPILLIVAFIGVAQMMFSHQIGLYLVGAELDRRLATVRDFAEALAQGPAEPDNDALARIASLYEDKFPGIEVSVQRQAAVRYPPQADADEPPPGWGEASGLLEKEGLFYAWAHAVRNGRKVTVLAPLTDDILSTMIPNLGDVLLRGSFDAAFAPSRTGVAREFVSVRGNGKKLVMPARITRSHIPEAWHSLDIVIPVPVPAIVPYMRWNQPGKQQEAFLILRSRPSSVINVIYSQRSDKLQGVLPALLVGIGILLVLVEAVAFVIGTSLTRSITGAVHELYEGTQRVMEGNFRHRIRVKGQDQLATLGASFNQMTERIEQLLVVAKEKERLESEIEIAREVQSQLYPKLTPKMETLQITATCQPARMVSGDYYDYQLLDAQTLAFAFGDVAGKGISAALLMATLQSNMRTQLHFGQERHNLSPAGLVSQLNVQLHAHTAPEKYATFFFGIFDETSGTLRYTNAGHLPPLLFRGDEYTPLSVDGMVVGAMPKSLYEESRITLDPGDLLVCYTDGVTEPENEYGEMFGEERMIEAIRKNRNKSNDEIISCVMTEVRQWTGSPELQDDMTMLLARRL